MDQDLVDQVIDVAQRVVASGAISANGHGNVTKAGIYLDTGSVISIRPSSTSIIAATETIGLVIE